MREAGKRVVRQSQWRWDFTAASLGAEEVTIPDISSKSAAQKTIGLDMEKLLKEKEQFKKVILPGWKKSAE